MIHLPRTGDSPLALPEGAELVTTADSTAGNRDAIRYHEIVVYRLTGDRYAIGIRYVTKWQGEAGHDTAEVVTGSGEVRGFLRDYDPLEWYVGPPADSSHGRGRRQREERDITVRWDHAVSEVLALWPERVE